MPLALVSRARRLGKSDNDPAPPVQQRGQGGQRGGGETIFRTTGFRRRDFFEAETTAVRQRRRVGEFPGAYVPNPRWNDEPAVQLFDPQTITTLGDVADGTKVFDGVGVDAFNNLLRCYPGGSRTPIRAANFIHRLSGDGINPVHGLSESAQAAIRIESFHGALVGPAGAGVLVTPPASASSTPPAPPSLPPRAAATRSAK